MQASRHEGFGLAVAEAMLAGCVPVVMNVTAMPEVVGDAGVLIESQRPEEVADGVRRALGAGAGRESLCARAYPHGLPDGESEGRDLASGGRGAWPGVSERGQMRRRLREQLRVREALLLDLGALVYELHRQGKRAPGAAPGRRRPS